MTATTFPASTHNVQSTPDLNTRLLISAFSLLPLTGIAIPGLLNIFDIFALVALAANYKIALTTKFNGHAWLFAGLICTAYSFHIFNPNIPSDNALIFLKGAISCVLIATLLSVMRRKSIPYEKAINAYVAGILISGVYAAAALAVPELTQQPFLSLKIEGSGRSFGLSKHSNLLGIHAAMGLLLIKNMDYRQTRNFVFYVSLLACLIIAGSRSGLVLLVLGILVTIVFTKNKQEFKKQLQILAGFATLGGLALLYTPQGKFLFERSTGTSGVSGDDERSQLFNIGINNVREFWLTGSPYEGRLFHNIYLTYFGILGIVGITALILFILLRLRSIWKLRTHPIGITALATFIALFATLAIHNAVSEPVIWFIALSPILINKTSISPSTTFSTKI